MAKGGRKPHPQMARMAAVDDVLVGIGRVIGKPRGWERVVRALAPPRRFANRGLRQTKVPEGYVFAVDRGTLVGWNVHFFGSYEPEVRDAIKRWLPPGAVAVDVGANVGWHTLLMAGCVGVNGRVCAFEPNDSTRARLEAGVSGNGLTHVSIDPRALSDRCGWSGFSAPDAGHVWDGTGHLVEGSAEGGVACVTLDAFVAEQGLDRVDFIKIDVEGWELSVLRGAKATLRERRPVLVFEFDPAYVARCGGSAAALDEVLTDGRYALFLLTPRNEPARVSSLGDRGGNFLAVPIERATS